MMMDLKQGESRRKIWAGAVGTKLGYKVDCKKSGWTGKVYGCTGVRYGDWNHTRWMELNKFGY